MSVVKIIFLKKYNDWRDLDRRIVEGRLHYCRVKEWQVIMSIRSVYIHPFRFRTRSGSRTSVGSKTALLLILGNH
jgi:hypothetical protein